VRTSWRTVPSSEAAAAVVVTVMSTVPAAAAGDVAVIWLALSAVNADALAEPNLTAEAPVRFVPVIVTDVPPPVGPLFGLTLVTAGAGGGLLTPYGADVTWDGSEVVETESVNVLACAAGFVTFWIVT
jgi:hypothetical protein